MHQRHGFSRLRPLAALAVACCPLLGSCASTVSEPVWGRFRGPNGSGIGAETLSVPDSLDPASALWRTEVLPGYSSPVLGTDALFLTGFEGATLYTYCIERDSGAVRWRAEAPPLAQAPRGPNSPVSSTPVTDGTNVYVFLENVGLISYAPDGSERWTHALGDFRTPYGMGTSPVLAGDTLLLQCDQDVGSYLIAINAADGSLRWRTERPGVTHGFSSPIVYRPEQGEAEVIVSGSYQVAGYSLASGEKLWWMDGLAWQAKSVPSIVDDTLFVHSWMAAPTEFGVKKVTIDWATALADYDGDNSHTLAKEEVEDLGMPPLWFLFDLNANETLDEEEWNAILARGSAKNGLWAVRLGGRGNITASHPEWYYKRSLPNIPSPLVYGELVYLLKDGGVVSALSRASGELVKSGRVEGGEGQYIASPVAAGGRLITSTQDGRVAVLAAGEDWSTLSVSAFDEEVWATPALGQDRIFLRTQAALYCFGS